MISTFRRVTLGTSFAFALFYNTALAENFSVTFEGKIGEVEEMDLDAPQGFQNGADYRYTVYFDTSDYLIRESGQKRDALSFVRAEFFVGDFSANVNSGHIELFAKLDGADILSMESAELSDGRNDLNLEWLQLRIAPPNSNFVQSGNSLSDVFQNLSKMSDYGSNSWMDIGFVDAANYYGGPMVRAEASIEVVSFKKSDLDEPNLKAAILSDDEVSALGSGLFRCLRDDQVGWERSHADRTRNEDFLVALSPSFVEDIEKRAAENNASYRVITVGYERKEAPYINTTYFLILERTDGQVVVTPEYQQMGGTEYKKLDGSPCSPGAWAAPLEAYMVEVAKEEPVAIQSNEGFQIPNGQSIRADLVGAWHCEGQGMSENKGVAEKWNSSTNFELMPDGKFQRSVSFFQGDDTVQTTSIGHWFADDHTVTLAASFQNVEQLIVDGEEVPKLLLALGSLADGILGTNKKQVFDVAKRGMIWSRLTLEEKGDLPATCELLDD